MKKNYSFFKYATIVLLFLGFANVSNAQTAIDVTSEGWSNDWSWNGAVAKVTNPLINEINGNATVWEFTPTEAWGGFAYGKPNNAELGIDFSTYSKFECMVYCPSATEAIKLFIEAEGAGEGVDLGLIECKDGWAIATGSVAAWDSSLATKFAIKNGNYNAGMKIYFDNIKFIDPSGLNTIMFEDAETITQAWDWSWGGMSHTTIENPAPDAVNGTSKVKELFASAEWAGLAQGYSAGIESIVDFSVYSELSMLIYCPLLPTLQLEIGITDNISFEVNESCDAGWIKITQDVSSWAGKGGEKFIIKNGNGTAETPIYIDEIKFSKPNTNKIPDNKLLDSKVFFNGKDIVIECEETFSYSLHNILGHVVARGEAGGTALIETSNFSKGIYIAKIVSNKKENIVKISLY